jgi:uncharacterized NAD-dependent epimerase/dehydratase family protein
MNLDAARLTNPDALAVGVSLNTSRLAPEEALAACRQVEDELGLPCEDPVKTGVRRIADHLLSCFAN